MKLKHIILSICILLSISAQSQTKSNPKKQAERPKIGLVLSGGGAKGSAHIGVLKYFEEIGLPIDYVTGTSMGSIIGGMYSLGYSANELDTLISNLDWSIYMSNNISRDKMSSDDRIRKSTYLLTIPFNFKDGESDHIFTGIDRHDFLSSLPSSFIDGSKLTNLFNGLCVGYQDSMSFNDLPIPFACVATNIRDGKEVVLRSGSMPIAMRASMAIPGVFEPVRINGMHLVDGGLVNNIPVDVCKEMGADILIGIEVNDEVVVGDDQLKSLPQLALQLVNITGEEKAEKNRKLCDIYIHPNIKGYNTLSFEKESIDTLIQRGYQAARQYKDVLLALKEQIDSYGPIAQTHKAPKARSIANEYIIINSVNFSDNIGKQEGNWLCRKGKLKEGTIIKGEDIEKAIETYKGTGSYSEVTYKIKQVENENANDTLEAFDINLRLRKSEPHSIGFGFRYDTEESASVLLNISLNHNRLTGAKLDFTTKLGYNPYINTTFTWANRGTNKISASYEFYSADFKTYVNEDDLENINFRSNRFSIYISEFHLFSFNGALGVRCTILPHIKFPFINNEATDDFNFGPFLRAQFDNMDNAFFAMHGSKTTLDANLNFGRDKQERFGSVQFSWESYFTPNDWRITLIPQIYISDIIGTNNQLINSNFVGGSFAGRYLNQQLPFVGSLYTNMTNNFTAIARFDVRVRLFKRHYASGICNYLRHSDKIEKFFTNGESFDNWGFGLKYTLDSHIGPISLEGQWSDLTHKFSAYFSLGYKF
ncbi:MAG: patatin-like phospholipase family protein [Bacteroidales bacterium]|nr:patatin-like phospholipase family protein [Bacteroidales bacterium]